MLGGYGRLEAVLGGEVPAADVAVLGPRNQHPLVLHEGLHTRPNLRMAFPHKPELCRAQMPACTAQSSDGDASQGRPDTMQVHIQHQPTTWDHDCMPRYHVPPGFPVRVMGCTTSRRRSCSSQHTSEDDHQRRGEGHHAASYLRQARTSQAQDITHIIQKKY